MRLGRFSLAVLAQVLEYIRPRWLDRRTESMFLSWSHDTMACCRYFILSLYRNGLLVLEYIIEGTLYVVCM